MMRDRVLPDQIHNYSHNNQWLVEDLEFIGRVHDAVDLAKNLISEKCSPGSLSYSARVMVRAPTIRDVR